MARRRPSSGPSLESDSFLDVVANIVGILIILIVIVGVRVGQSASADKQREKAAAAVVAAVPAPVVAPRPMYVEPPPIESPPAPVASPELLAEIDATREETQRLKSEQRAVQERVARIEDAAVAVAAHEAAARAEQVLLAESLSDVDVQDARLGAQIGELQAELDGLTRRISDVPAARVTVIRHQLNPIGREVRGKELHFRLAEGRVAQIPLEALVERLKPEIEREKDWIARYRKHRGTIGPIDGFSMDYVVERERLSVVEQLQSSAQMMRISVSGWKIKPEPELVTETAEDALGGDSRFITALRLAERGTTLTFWVYPDSFEAYRKLQEAAHAVGFTVAARPLPAGVPIAGSPNGSRSSGQ